MSRFSKIKELTDELNARDEQLHILNQQYALALEGARMGTWTWHIETDVLIWDERMFKLFGIASKDFEHTYGDFLSLVSDEDRLSVDLAVKQSVATRANYNIVYNVKLPCGKTRAIEAKGTTILNKAGETEYLAGTCVEYSPGTIVNA